jgi:transposase, IS5 family
MAKKLGLSPKQTFEREGQVLRRKAGGYAHARQFKRLRKLLCRKCAILGVLMRDVQLKMGDLSDAAQAQQQDLLDRVARILAQAAAKANPSGRGKLYALHAPEVECIGKGKAHKPFEFGVKSKLAVTPDGQAATMAQATLGGCAGDWARQAGSRDATLLAQGIRG